MVIVYDRIYPILQPCAGKVTDAQDCNFLSAPFFVIILTKRKGDGYHGKQNCIK